jgi:hypothetical protein
MCDSRINSPESKQSCKMLPALMASLGDFKIKTVGFVSLLMLLGSVGGWGLLLAAGVLMQGRTLWPELLYLFKAGLIWAVNRAANKV